jgi:DNA-binding response OmpR family regulator
MKKILIVDDNAEMRQLIKLSLWSKYEVSEADSAANASIELEKFRPDLILLDIMMQRLNGLVWCKMIRSCYKYKDVKIILISALDQKEDVINGIESGANGYISKPFSIIKLIDEIEHHLS